MPQIPSSIRHRVCAVPASDDALPALARLLREDAAAAGPDAPPPRTIVFAKDERTAKNAAKALRASLWGVHTLAVLLPTGKEPTRAAHAFRDGRASLLLATPAAARGLDLPAVEAVYSLGPPGGGAADYLHRAGRAGRLGVREGEFRGLVFVEEVREGLEGAGTMTKKYHSLSFLVSKKKMKKILKKTKTQSSNGIDKDRAVVTSVVVAGGEEEKALREAAAALRIDLEGVEAPAPPADLFSVPAASSAEEAEEAEEEREGATATTAAAEAAAGASGSSSTAAADEALRRGLEDIFWTREAPEPEASRGRGGRAEEEAVDENDDDDDADADENDADDGDWVRPEDREE